MVIGLKENPSYRVGGYGVYERYGHNYGYSGK